jgi:lipopolysaccharide transport system permease protein
MLPLDIPHYAPFVYTSLLPWTWFQVSVTNGATALLDNRDLVRKPFFVRPLLPAVVAGSQFVLYLLALPVLLVLMLAEGMPIRPGFLLLPLVWMPLAVWTLACTTLVAALGVLIRDIQHLLGVVLMLLFYLTPVFYDLDRVPPRAAALLRLNPIAVIVEGHRALTSGGPMPSWTALGLWGLGGTALLVMSLALFHALEHQLIEEV